MSLNKSFRNGLLAMGAVQVGDVTKSDISDNIHDEVPNVFYADHTPWFDKGEQKFDFIITVNDEFGKADEARLKELIGSYTYVIEID